MIPLFSLGATLRIVRSGLDHEGLISGNVSFSRFLSERKRQQVIEHDSSNSSLMNTQTLTNNDTHRTGTPCFER
jgi:hypothetical protein